MPRQKSTHVDDPAAVGRRLKQARERAGLSQRKLSFPGCSPAYISRIEAGDRIPSLQLLRELGRRLGVSEDYLATGTQGAAFQERGLQLQSALVEAELALRLDEVEQARRLYEQILAEAPDAGSRSAALEGLGHLALRTGEPREAVGLFGRALVEAGSEAPDRPTLAEGLGRSYATLGEFTSAIALLERCAERYEREENAVLYVRFACLLGYALTDNGDFAEAEQVVARALEAGQEIADTFTRARLYWSQSRLLAEQGRGEASAFYAQRALETLRTTEDSHFIGLGHQLLAMILIDTGRAEEALELLREGWPLIASTATPIELAHFRMEEARALAAVGQREEAAALAMELTGKLGDALPIDVGNAYILLGRIFDDLGDAARARELYELGVELLEQHAPNRYLVDAYKRLAELLEREGHADDALDVLKRALSARERTERAIP